LNVFEGDPFTRIEKKAKETRFKTHSTHASPKPN